jgi:hypothetical protein
VYRFVTETPENARRKAEQRFREHRRSLHACAWVYDAYITLSDGKFDTVIAELSDRNASEGLLIAQPYRLAGSLVERVGNLETQIERSWFAG